MSQVLPTHPQGKLILCYCLSDQGFERVSDSPKTTQLLDLIPKTRPEVSEDQGPGDLEPSFRPRPPPSALPSWPALPEARPPGLPAPRAEGGGRRTTLGRGASSLPETP